jgi:hypothetical protein
MDQSPDLALASRQLSREALQRSGELQLHVISTSMAPLLKPGDAVLVQPARIQDLQLGQIVVYERGSDWITHRLVQQDRFSWTLKGDACLAPDAPVQPSEIIGRVVSRIRLLSTSEKTRLDLLQKRWLWLGSFTAFLGRLQSVVWLTTALPRSKTTHPFGLLQMKVGKGLCWMLHKTQLGIEGLFISLFS